MPGLKLGEWGVNEERYFSFTCNLPRMLVPARGFIQNRDLGSDLGRQGDSPSALQLWGGFPLSLPFCLKIFLFTSFT